MRAHLAANQRALAQADAVIAVSTTVGRDLIAKAPTLEPPRVHVIPNPLNLSTVDAAARNAPPADISRPYAIYVGKLAPNKGVAHLVPAAVRARLGWPLVIVGDGPSRGDVERAATAAGVDARFTGWLDRDAALQRLAHAAVLVFPSLGPESLSRVLLEAGALGVPVAAMDTGGTRDVVEPDRTGLLSATPQDLGDDLRRLVEDGALRQRLGESARAFVRERFSAPLVVDRIVTLYRRLLTGSRRRAGGAAGGRDAGIEASSVRR
jgi:glycosyltransferase involved in cell wall biosynthesis